MSEKQFRLPRKFAEEKWFPALLGGTYLQTTGYLTNEKYDEDCEVIPNSRGYCCLGVACKVVGVSDEDMTGCVLVDNDPAGHDFELTQKALDLGFPEELVCQNDGGPEELCGKLAELNDTDGCTFEEIVQWIKENVELYESEE